MAKHERLQRNVALKLIPKHTLDASSLVRFETEARALAQVAHPNVVSVYDAGVLAGLPYLALEFVEGESLQEKLRRSGPLSPRHAAAPLTRPPPRHATRPDAF